MATRFDSGKIPSYRRDLTLKVYMEILQRCRLDQVTFSTHERYSERMIPDLLTVACEISGDSMETVGIWAGESDAH